MFLPVMRFLAVLHDCFHSSPGIGGWEQLIAYPAGVAAGFQMTDDLGVIDLTGARLMASRCICHMDMSHLIHIVGNGITDAALIDLHVVYIVQQLQTGRVD